MPDQAAEQNWTATVRKLTPTEAEKVLAKFVMDYAYDDNSVLPSNRKAFLSSLREAFPEYQPRYQRDDLIVSILELLTKDPGNDTSLREIISDPSAGPKTNRLDLAQGAYLVLQQNFEVEKYAGGCSIKVDRKRHDIIVFKTMIENLMGYLAGE